MSGTSSATGGPLSPAASNAPLDDASLADFLQRLVVDITALPGTMVRPRWQPTPAPRPSATTDWCAIGVLSISADPYVNVAFDPADQGSSTLKRHETLEIVASFYGPCAQGNASLLRDGLQMGQNRETLSAADFGFYDTGDVISVPELLNNQWLPRCDLIFRLRRRVTRRYEIRTLLSASGSITTDGPSTTFNVEP